MERLNEDSPNTLEGSFTRDLIFSKFWLADQIRDAMRRYRVRAMGTVVALGSWYGNLGIILDNEGFPFDQMVLVDKDPLCARFASWLYRPMKDRFVSSSSDANEFDYGSCKGPLLVINTSCNDMPGSAWFRRIPAGALVALQSRSDHESLGGMDHRYPMSRTMFLGKKSLEDPEERYTRFMKIGLK